MRLIYNNTTYLFVALFMLTVAVFVTLASDKLSMIVFNLIRDSLITATTIAAFWSVGRLMEKIMASPSYSLESILTCIGLGATCYAVILFIIGVLNILYLPVIVFLIAIGLLLGIKDYSDIIEILKTNNEISYSFNLTYSEIIIIIVVSMIGMVAFTGVIMPEIFYDALYYHDAFGDLYLIRHGIDVFPFAVHNALPSNINLIYIPIIGLGKASTVKLAHFLFGAGSCLWIYSMGKLWFNRAAGLCGALIFAALPGVGAMAGLGAVDLGVCFFTLGAMALLARWIFDEEGKSTLIESAILLGMAVGCKYSALLVAVVLALGVLAGSIKRSRVTRVSAMNFILYGGVTIFFACPWYIRNLIVWGNPLYPAFEPDGSQGRFGFMNLRHDSEPIYGWAATLWKLPGDILLQEGAFGAGAELWPGAILICAAVIWAFGRKGFARWSAIAILIMYLLWSRSILIVRYFYPGLALGAVLTGGLLMPKDKKKYLTVLVMISLVIISLISLRRLARFQEMYYGGTLNYITKSISTRNYLAKHAPHTRAAAWIKRNTSAVGTKLLFIGETRGYYFKRDYEPVSAYDQHPIKKWIGKAKNASSLNELLKAKGFTHIIYNNSEMERLNRSYSHCVLTDKEEKIFKEFLNRTKLLAKGARIKIFLLE